MNDDFTKMRIGCAILGIVLVCGPFLYLYLAGGGFGGGGEAEPAAGTPEAIDRQMRSSPQEALDACRKALAGDLPDDRKKAFAERLPRCLESLYDARRAKEEWVGCEEILGEMQSAHADASETARVSNQWRQDSAKWLKKATDQGDWETAARLAEVQFADARWNPISWDDPVLVYLERRWQAEWDAGRTAEAEQVLLAALDDSRTGRHHRVARNWRTFLDRALRQAWETGDRAEADRRFDAMVSGLEIDNARLPLAAYGDYLKARVLVEGASFLEKLKDVGDHASTNQQTGIMKGLNTALREQAWRKAAAGGDFAAAEAVFENLDPYPYWVDRPLEQRQLAELRLMRWRAARDAGRMDEARKALEEVIAHQSDQVDHAALMAAVRDEWSAGELLALGDDLQKKGNPSGALACYEVLQETGTAPDGLAERIDRCLLDSARHYAQWAHRMVSWGAYAEAEKLYAQLVWDRPSFKTDATSWRAAGEELLAMQVQWADHYSDNEMFEPAEKALERAMRKTGLALWEARLAEPGFDAWGSAPLAAREQVEKSVPDDDPAKRIDALRRLAAKGGWVVPEAAAATAMLATVRERSAMAQAERALVELQWKDGWEKSLDVLRKVTRKYRNTAAFAKVKEGLEAVIARAQSTVHFLGQQENGLSSEQGIEDFTRLSDLLGFYVAEIGPPAADDDFRDRLKQWLTDASELAARHSPMARVFLLSLLADALPDDPAGQQARRDALAKGFELMEQLPPNEPPASPDAPSLVPGLSSIRLHNSTPYHLLVFLKGPEEFYARLNPFSRGTVVLADGEYDTAVIVTRDEVRPYRGRTAYQAVMRTEGYVIERTGGGQPTPEEELREITGDFRLLRAPETAGPVFLDPDSGVAIGAGGK